AGVQGVLLVKVLLESSVRVVPRPEVVELPQDLLGPAFRRMGEQWELGIGLVWLLDLTASGFADLGLRCRIGLCHADSLAKVCQCGFGRLVTSGGHLSFKASGVRSGVKRLS